MRGAVVGHSSAQGRHDKERHAHLAGRVKGRQPKPSDKCRVGFQRGRKNAAKEARALGRGRHRGAAQRRGCVKQALHGCVGASHVNKDVGGVGRRFARKGDAHLEPAAALAGRVYRRFHPRDERNNPNVGQVEVDHICHRHHTVQVGVEPAHEVRPRFREGLQALTAARFKVQRGLTEVDERKGNVVGVKGTVAVDVAGARHGAFLGGGVAGHTAENLRGCGALRAHRVLHSPDGPSKSRLVALRPAPAHGAADDPWR